MTATAMEHASWCVRKHDKGQCSSKRGKWDRSTNTWDSDMTQKDRIVIRDALALWKDGTLTMAQAAEYVRQFGETLDKIEDSALLTWNMTQKRMMKKGKSWPI